MSELEKQGAQRPMGGASGVGSHLDSEPVRILAVDDNPVNLRALDALLEGIGVEVVTASSGDAALKLLMDQDFALILLDVRMPGQSGFDVAKLIRGRPRSSHVPIIFLTASENTDQQMLEGYALGAVDFLFKPIISEILISKVNVFVELHRQTRHIQRQADLLREAERREHAHHIEEMSKKLEEERLLSEIERERRLSNERVQAIRARDEFISIASHELRTPLTPLTLRVQSLKQAIEQLDREQLLETTAKIEGYVRRLTRLVDTLLDVSRVTHGRLQLQLTEFELSELVREVAGGLDGESTRAGSTISIHAAGPVEGRWDRARLEQIFTNLLTNAIKYGLGKPIDVTLNKHGSNAEITVKDRGIGIAADDQERVFERFERAVPPTHFGGFGLGLWIVRHLVEAHHGVIRLESSPTQGTTVFLSLPLRS
jgi:signal transduction histidine kinase